MVFKDHANRRYIDRAICYEKFGLQTAYNEIILRYLISLEDSVYVLLAIQNIFSSSSTSAILTPQKKLEKSIKPGNLK